MGNFIVIGILLIIVSLAVRYIWKEKKKGTKCIGCPSSGGCSCGGCKNASHESEVKENKKSE